MIDVRISDIRKIMMEYSAGVQSPNLLRRQQI
jgi:hypothetical protein